MAADSNIFAQYLRPVKSMQDYSNDMDAAEQNKMALAAGRMKAQQDQQELSDNNAFRALLSSGIDVSTPAGQAQLYGAAPGKAGAFLKSRADLAKTTAETGRIGSQTAKDNQDVDSSKLKDTITKLEHGASILSTAKDQQTYDIAIRTLEATFPGASREMPPQFDPQVVAAKLATGQTIKEKLAAELAQSTLAQTVVRDTQTNDRGIASDATARAGQKNTADIAAAGRAQSAAQFGETKKFQREQFDYAKQKDATKPAPGAAKTGPMSVTMQKELLEADDTVQSAGNVVNTLKSALKINDKAYSGYFAKGRAQVVSNLGGTDSADATIDIDNMMTGQALESLKVVFGGMPTEGERKILLEMQASADKTPDQRKAIMTRAIAAAERRAQYAGSKAKAIRGGTYLTDGAEPVPVDAPKPAGAMSPEDTQAMDWANKNPNDPRAKQIKQRLGGG